MYEDVTQVYGRSVIGMLWRVALEVEVLAYVTKHLKVFTA